MQLKEYQQKALNWLRGYFQLAVRLNDADTAFYQLTQEIYGQRIPYRQAPGLLDMPYICLRIPTGGGKTLVAAHAVGLAARELLRADTPMVLWLVPSNAILDQTINALKERNHPYRQALEQSVGGAVNVLNVQEALRVNRPTLDGGLTVVVSTIQAFRVDDTEGRKVYETSGHLMDHFNNLPPELAQRLETWENGRVIPSLANVLRLRRPIVVVDEAHNARTDLSFETLSRFDPSCIMEFTATPDTEHQPSNVLYSVSAAELKAEQMIKMPILLSTRPQWKELLADAIAQLNELQRAAEESRQGSGEYIRPIMLLQAEAKSSIRETITVEMLKQTLEEEFSLPSEQIALSAYDYDDLAGVNVLDPNCKIRFVITVSKLKEGWDCPFAYILCSVAEVRSATAVEQLLGRIMRMPYVRRKDDERLNQAYAFAASNNFAQTASSLIDGLVENGFERFDAEEMIRQRQPQQQYLGPLFDQSVGMARLPLPPPDREKLSILPASVAAQIEEDEDGSFVFVGPMSTTARDALQTIYTQDADRAAVANAYVESQKVPASQTAPATRGEIFSVPVLAYQQGTLLEQFEASHFLDQPWQLQNRDTVISEDFFPTEQPAAQIAQIDITQERQLSYRFLDRAHSQMRLLARDQGWTETDLILWLDRQIPHPDIPAPDSQAFIAKVLQRLQRERNLSLDRLVHDKYRLRSAIANKIDEHRRTIRENAFQQILLEAPVLTVTPDLCFTYDPNGYPVNRVYKGQYEFNKHYYLEIGALDTDEEFRCAQFIDTLDEVDVWVRNPTRTAKAFWLQTSTDKFYPDFVCRLKDGRYLVVEYKGEVYRTNDDSAEKNRIGELWERRSQGRCLFLMVSNRNFVAISSKIR